MFDQHGTLAGSLDWRAQHAHRCWEVETWHCSCWAAMRTIRETLAAALQLDGLRHRLSSQREEPLDHVQWVLGDPHSPNVHCCHATGLQLFAMLACFAAVNVADANAQPTSRSMLHLEHIAAISCDALMGSVPVL